MSDAYELDGTPWKNRIVGFDEVNPADLLANPHNPKIHPKAQQDALAGALSEIGWIDTPTVNISTGNLIDGHARVNLALRNNEQAIPVIFVELTEAEEKLALATFDPIGAMAATDAEKLDDLLRDVQTGDADLQAMLSEMAEDAGLYFGENGHEEADAEPQVDRAEELRQKWGVEPGQLWALGEHRLIVGDCTDQPVVTRLMRGEQATLAPVDPPYNVGFDYDGESVDDSKVDDEYERFSRSWFAVCQSVSERQIVTPGCNNLALWLRWFDAYHWAPWTKTNSMTNGKVSRFWCWEPVLFFGDSWPRKRPNDVFDYPIGMQSGVANHPCPKPLKMWEDLIENYSEEGDVIYEAFSGSGTTIIAAENLSRQCRAVEISPGYVAVALQRYFDAFGITPELVTE